MTDEQNTAMQDLAEDTQVRMIQGILGVFGYTPEVAARNYNVSEGEARLLLQRPTFGSQRDETSDAVFSSTSTTTSTSSTTTTTTTVAPVISSSSSTSTTTTTTTTTPAPTTTTTTVESLIIDSESLTLFPEVQKSTENPLNVDLSKPVFLRYQPQDDSQFQTLPPLSSVVLGLCGFFKSLGSSLLIFQDVTASKPREMQRLHFQGGTLKI